MPESPLPRRPWYRLHPATWAVIVVVGAGLFYTYFLYPWAVFHGMRGHYFIGWPAPYTNWSVSAFGPFAVNDYFLLGLDVVAWLAAIASPAILCEWLARRRFQFPLLALFGVLTVVAFVAGRLNMELLFQFPPDYDFCLLTITFVSGFWLLLLLCLAYRVLKTARLVWKGAPDAECRRLARLGFALLACTLLGYYTYFGMGRLGIFTLSILTAMFCGLWARKSLIGILTIAGGVGFLLWLLIETWQTWMDLLSAGLRLVEDLTIWAMLMVVGPFPSSLGVLLVLAGPTIIVLLTLTFALARGRGERLSSLLSGGLGAAAIALTRIFYPLLPPSRWIENNLGLCLIAGPMAGAALGVGVVVCMRRLLPGSRHRLRAKTAAEVSERES